MSFPVIIAFTADNIKQPGESASASDDVSELTVLSQKVQHGEEIFRAWVLNKGGKVVALGAGSGRLEVDATHIDELLTLKDQYNQAVGSPCSVGVGRRLSEAEKAMAYAQMTGGNRVELFTAELEEELYSLEEENPDEKMFSSFFKAEPGMNRGSGGGFMGHTQPKAAEAPEMQTEDPKPEDPPGQAPAQPVDLARQFGDLAEKSQNAVSQQQEEQAQRGQKDDLRSSVVEVLKQFKEQGPLWEQLKDSQPDAYKTLTAVIQAMIALARQAFMDDAQSESEPVQKSEDLGKKVLDPSLGYKIQHEHIPGPEGTQPLLRLKAFAPNGDIVGHAMYSHQGNNIQPVTIAVEDDHQRKGLGSAMHAHAQGVTGKSLIPSKVQTDEGEALSAATYAPKVPKAPSPVAPVAPTIQKTVTPDTISSKHLLHLPVGSQIDPSPSGADHGGKVKVKDPSTGKTKWRSMRSGVKMDEEGLPTSARNK